MKGRVEVDAGICGFKADIAATCEDGQFVTLGITSGCEKVAALAKKLTEAGAVDAFQEISPVGESVILSAARETHKGCCAACVIPIGVFKAMQVAAGLALPQDAAIRIARE